ncbi:MAG: dienelactone hydrolase family protein, partial [Betaproteobacteria bacterium]
DWGLVNRLRTGLAEQGYTTLSVQMPVLAADADAARYPPLYPEAAERLSSAVAYLRARSMGKIAIVAHSLGARMADFFVNRMTDPGVDAWVAIGMPGDFISPQAFKQPVLDIYGEGDFPALLENAEKRASVLRKLRGSAQIRIAEADHFFNGREAELVRHVRLFLDRALK